MSPNFLNGITLLLVYQLVGEVSTRLLNWPVPGPVLGMLLLFITLLLSDGLESVVEPASSALLSHLSLLFVPAGVGVMVHVGRIGSAWLPISMALIFGTLITMAVTAWVMVGMQRLLGRRSTHAA
ncbi:LrgA family protein [Thiothrix caldifontis]|jgi:Putative effector of murein hydrolase LrgA|uniref:LrgA family protein n=1 Tax=Thiothrix caldifontis TaxID=525918 RepID=A0A1H4FTL4_9GAMM|nr:CidA/LrgA family protein [Thiothrix caldifontis]SEB00683.1 LrgA family protein [Thiothrix caldifontis]